MPHGKILRIESRTWSRRAVSIGGAGAGVGHVLRMSDRGTELVVLVLGMEGAVRVVVVVVFGVREDAHAAVGSLVGRALGVGDEFGGGAVEAGCRAGWCGVSGRGRSDSAAVGVRVGGEIEGGAAFGLDEEVAEAEVDGLFLLGGVPDLGAQEADLAAGAALDLAGLAVYGVGLGLVVGADQVA